MMNNKGIVLPVTLAFVLAFTLLGSATIYLSTTQNEAAEQRIASEKAFWLAEAGIQRALWEVKQNSCRGLVSKASGLACTTGCAICGEKKLASADGEMEGHYNLDMSSASSVVTATGSYPSRAPASNRSQRTVQLASTSQFNYAIFAEEKIMIHNNTIIDSYNSDLGPYDKKKNMFSNGDIGSNKGGPLLPGEESISFMNSPFINGNISTGPGGKISVSSGHTIEEYINKKNTITYDNEVDLPLVVVPFALINLKKKSSPQKLDVDRPVTISAEDHKDYVFSSIDVHSSGKLIIDGDVRIYVTDSNTIANFEVSGSSSEVIINPNSSLTLYTDGDVVVQNNADINNLTKDPKKLTIYSTVSSSKKTKGVDINNSSDFYGAIYAPEAHISITNNGNIFGSFVGRSFYVPNSVKLHYDESLAEKITNPTTVWEEISGSIVP